MCRTDRAGSGGLKGRTGSCSGCCSSSPPGGGASPSCPSWAAQEKPGARAALARQYAAEALAEESELEITGVEVEELEGDRLRVHVRLDWNGEALSTSVTV